jgi:hypothetical protein
MADDFVPERESGDFHSHEIEDCPVNVKNRQEGWRPFIRIEFLKKEGDDNITVHICGLKSSIQLAVAMNALSQELLHAMAREDEAGEEAS